MNRKGKLLVLAALLVLSIALQAAPSQAAWYPPCDTYCPTATSGTICMCPNWSDRPYRIVTCGSWNRVGACWYE